MSKLQPLENTVVHLKTQAEYDEYMQLAEEAGWKWSSDTTPFKQKNNWFYWKGSNLVEVKDCFTNFKNQTHLNKHKKNTTILTLTELKAKFGISTKPTTWEPHYTKDGHQISRDKIKLASGKEYTPAELQAELNLLRSISKAHKKFFPSSR